MVARAYSALSIWVLFPGQKLSQDSELLRAYRIHLHGKEPEPCLTWLEHDALCNFNFFFIDLACWFFSVWLLSHEVAQKVLREGVWTADVSNFVWKLIHNLSDLAALAPVTPDFLVYQSLVDRYKKRWLFSLHYIGELRHSFLLLLYYKIWLNWLYKKPL